MIDEAWLAAVAPDFLAGRRWFSGGGQRPERAEVLSTETLQKELPALVRALIGVDGDRYQVVVGLRPSDEHHEFLHGQESGILGTTEVDGCRLLAYDAVLDHELSLVLLRSVTDGAEDATLVRPIGAEQSNTSLVYDERLVLKLFRRIHAGPNPDVEVTSALAEVGFDHVAAPVAVCRDHGADLAIVQPFLAGATDGWALALTSLRDLYGSGCLDPAACGGDFAGEATRLGTVTAQMHLALAEAFGTVPGRPADWTAGMRRQLERVAPDEAWTARANETFERLSSGPSGVAMRVHGDYHLGQVVRTDTGWFVLDFEGEPARPLEERRRWSSPMKDVAGMMRSFGYAAQVALHERSEEERADTGAQAAAWEAHNRAAFATGYLATPGVEALLPGDPGAFEAALAAWELDKAVYELAYERAHRPDWVPIPLAAVHRLADGG